MLNYWTLAKNKTLCRRHVELFDLDLAIWAGTESPKRRPPELLTVTLLSSHEPILPSHQNSDTLSRLRLINI